MLRKLFPISTVALLSLLFLSTLPAAEPEDLIKYRQNTMKAIGGHMGAIAAIVQGKVDMNHLKPHADALAATSMTVKDIFPEDSAVGETNAKTEIWDKPDEFQQAVTKLEQAAAAFATAADSGDSAQIGAAMKDLGGACKNCHDNFRQKKQ